MLLIEVQYWKHREVNITDTGQCTNKAFACIKQLDIGRLYEQ